VLQILKSGLLKCFKWVIYQNKKAVHFVELIHFFAESPNEPGLQYDDGTYAERGGSNDLRDYHGNSEATLEHVFNGPYQLQAKPDSPM